MSMLILKDGAIAAAELLALLLVAPAPAMERPATAAQSMERSVQLHRLSTGADMRLLGAIAEVRNVPRLQDERGPIIEHDAAASHADGDTDAVHIVQVTPVSREPGFLATSSDCDSVPETGHVRLTEDEAIADAMRPMPPAAPSDRGFGRPDEVDGPAPSALLVEQGDQTFLLVSPNRAATAAILVLRPASGSAAKFALGAVKHSTAILVPLANRQHLEDLAGGAIEMELVVDGMTLWTTVNTGRIDSSAALSTTVD